MHKVSSIQDQLTCLDRQWQTDQISKSIYHKRRKVYTHGRAGYTFNNERDVTKVIDKLALIGKDTSIYPVLHAYDPRRMIQLGLYPTSIDINVPWVVDWLNGVDLESIEFMSVEVSPAHTIGKLHLEMHWKYLTLETLRKQACEDAGSVALTLRDPASLYQQSHRPRTDMRIFLTLSSPLTGETTETFGSGWSFIPVTRYAKGMSKGMYYHDEPQTEFHGTFYYHEPESTTVLAYKTALRAFNKTDAAMKLGLTDETFLDTETLDACDDKKCAQDLFRFITDPDPSPVLAPKYPINNHVIRHLNGVYPRDLMLTPMEAFEIIAPSSETPPTHLPAVRHYAAEYLGLYAAEDYWDQPLCIAARKAGFDIVILENMVGAFQIVTEILDTRPRDESFRCLSRI